MAFVNNVVWYLKKIAWLALIGYFAAFNEPQISWIPIILFLIQFVWQFPHFWAIGWFLYEDYEKAGFFMLPTGKKDRGTALQIILYTVWRLALCFRLLQVFCLAFLIFNL